MVGLKFIAFHSDTAHTLTVICDLKQPEEQKEPKTYKLPKSKIRSKCYSFFHLKASQNFCAFYSISFPANLADNMCFKVFNTWLTRCRKEQKLKSYLWITERQKNGTLHYHMLTNNYMNIREVNNYMRVALLNQKRKGNIPNSINVPDNYNGVDVDNLYHSKRAKHKRKKMSKEKAQKKLSYYITKYITKNEEEFKHLAWHCSRDISALFTNVRFNNLDNPEIEALLSNNADKIKVITDDYFNLYVLMFEVPNKFFYKMFEINNQIYEWINKLE